MSKEIEDTLRPGFVSSIIVKFSQLSGTVLDDDKKSVFCKNKQPSLSKKLDNLKTKSTINDYEAKFEISGDVSVKDKIKAFSSMSQAVTTASKRPGVFYPNKPINSNLNKTSIPIAKSNVANKFLQSVEKKQEKKEIIKPVIDIKKDNIHNIRDVFIKPADNNKIQKPIINKKVTLTPEPIAAKQPEFEFEKEYSLADLIPESEQIKKDESLNELIKSDSASSVDSLLDEFASSEEKKLIYPEITLRENDPLYYPLPSSYKVSFIDGNFFITLPTPNTKSALKNPLNSSNKIKKNIKVIDQPTMLMETYNIEEYERGDDSIDPLTASAEYEIERKTDLLDKFEVELVKDERGLGLSIVGIGLGSDTGSEKLGIYVKALTAGGAAERTNMLMVHDQLLSVDGISLVGVSQSFAAQTLKATTKNVKFVIGRERTEP